MPNKGYVQTHEHSAKISNARGGTRQPPVVTDAHGLPRCAWCHGEDALCTYHRAQVAAALGQLKTAGMLGRDTVLRGLPPVRRSEDAE